jgi:TolA-binding protein
MTEISSSRRNARRLQTVGLAALLMVAFFLLIRVLMVPDPGGRLLWVRAQNLEERGLVQQALRQYQLLAQTHPQSPYAPAALLHCGDLLRDLARAGESGRISEALDFYQQLASRYPQHSLAGDALLRSGELYLRDLKLLPRARATYQTILRDYPNNAALASEATLRLGEVAQIARDGKTARAQFQQVLRLFPKQSERCAEAQYRLGETYETLFSDADRRIWARNAYEATIRNYPGSAWAGKAKERLGILVWGETAPRERRVLIQTDALPDEGQKSSSLIDALRMILAARGVFADGTVLRGWSLEPFYIGFSPDNPASVLKPAFAPWKNVVSSAGLVYRLHDGGPADEALQDLQRELDDAHATLIYAGRWQFVAGYDSLRDEVLLQNGGEMQPLPVKDFVKDWARRSEFGDYSLLSFHTPAEMPRPANASTQLTKPQPKTTPTPRPTPTAKIRARALLAWKNAPATRWIAMRRNAAAFLDIAAAKLKSPALKQAAVEFRASADALQNAAKILPATLGPGELSNASRRALENAAREIEKARDAERRATDILTAI